MKFHKVGEHAATNDRWAEYERTKELHCLSCAYVKFRVHNWMIKNKENKDY